MYIHYNNMYIHYNNMYIHYNNKFESVRVNRSR